MLILVSVSKRVYFCEANPDEELVSLSFYTVELKDDAPLQIKPGFKPEQRAPLPAMLRQLPPLTAVFCGGTHRHANRSTVEANEKEKWAKRASGRLAFKQQSPQCSPHIHSLTHRPAGVDASCSGSSHTDRGLLPQTHVSLGRQLNHALGTPIKEELAPF